MKRCTKCKRLLPLDAYNYTRAHGKRYLRGDCKQCVAFRAANWYQRRKKVVQPGRTAYMRTWRARDREAYNQEARRMRIARVLRRVSV